MIHRIEYPLIDTELLPLPGGGLKARHLDIGLCTKHHAVALTRRWHSRLPNVQDGPWQYAFKSSYGPVTYAVALWNNPSTRSLPHHWLELRRMAAAPDVPYNTCSRFLAWMVRYFREHCPERERCISYQDTEVHTGTIYKAANWHIAHVGKKRYRDRSKPRTGTNRMYRSNINTDDVDAAAKIRWEIEL